MPFLTLNDLPEKELIPGYDVRFVHTDNMSFAYWTVKASSPLPEHSHPHEQVTHVIQGQFELAIDGKTRALGENDVAVIPSNALHSGRAITDCKIIDAFYPVREDYR